MGIRFHVGLMALQTLAFVGWATIITLAHYDVRGNAPWEPQVYALIWLGFILFGQVITVVLKWMDKP